MFDINKWEPVGDAYEKNIIYCDDLTGFHPKVWATEFRPYYNYTKDYAEDHCDSTWKKIFKEPYNEPWNDEWDEY